MLMFWVAGSESLAGLSTKFFLDMKGFFDAPLEPVTFTG